MIALLRIDERLIHGQVATSWSKALDIDTIVCASDEAAQNPLKKKMLLIAAPPGKKTHVRSVDEVIGLLQDPRAERMKIFLLTDNPKDALKLVSALGLKNVNLGNYHNRKAEHTASVSMYVQLDRDDLGALKEISERVADAYVQSLPSTEKTSLKAFVYWITWLIDGILGWQTMTRPIVLGTVIGWLCGDLKTGVIMGASLEAVYMGISGIGGSLAADYRSGTAVGVGLAILSGISMEEGIAIAVPIGALCLGLMPVTTMVGNLMEVPLMNAAKQGDVKKYNRLVWFQAIVLQHLLDTAVIFLCCYFGSTVITTTFDAIPAWLMNGLSASGGMLVVVGLALTTQAIFSKYTVPFVLVGFVLTKYLAMPVLSVAILGFVCAYMVFDRSRALKQVENTVGGDDFYA